MSSLLSQRLPYSTADLPGIGGVIKQLNEDFRVEEVPLYPPCGDGTHTYFMIEKAGLSTLQAVQIIAKALGVRPRDIGFAGMKDAHGITRQTLSVEHVDPARVAGLNLARVKILWTQRHRNRLRLGHLKGNRFAIRVRSADFWDEEYVQAIMTRLTRHGAPNYFGKQRFGARGDNAHIGWALLQDNIEEACDHMLGRPGPLDHGQVLQARACYDQGDWARAAELWPKGFQDQKRACSVLARSGGSHQKAWQTVDRKLRELFLSAFQSELFNRLLAARLDRMDRLMIGDLAWKHANGAVFKVLDADAEQPRCDAFEISPSGPLFGRRMTRAEGEPGRMESRILADAGVDEALFGQGGSLRLDGARRPLRFRPSECGQSTGADHYGRFMELTFTLPKGCYATTLLREVCKNESELGESQ